MRPTSRGRWVGQTLLALVGSARPTPREVPSPSSTPLADSPQPADGARFLVIVPRAQWVLCEYLRRQFDGDATVRVFVDRRGPGPAARRPPSDRPCWVVDTGPSEVVSIVQRSDGQGRTVVEALEDRQRVDRWIEESKYLIGRMIPGLLDDRERVRTKLEAAEEECTKLRQEVGQLRKEVSDLQSETQYFRSEQVAIAETLKGIIDHVAHIQKPLSDVFRRLQSSPPPEVAG